MKQFLVLGLMIFLVGCNKEVKNENVIKNNHVVLENQVTEITFGEKEIKEFLLEADSFARECFSFGDKKTLEVIGKTLSSVVYRYDVTNYEKTKVLQELEKYFSPQMAILELNKSGVLLIDGEFGYSKYPFSEMLLLSEKSKIELVIDEEDRKVVKVQKFHPMTLEQMEIDFKNTGTIQYWEEYMLVKNQEQQWIISDEKKLNTLMQNDNGEWIVDSQTEEGVGETIFIPVEKTIYKWASVESFSTLKGYPIENIIDNNNTTAWAEGVKGDGIGQWLKLISEEPITVSSIVMLNGYQKSESLFYKNNRVKKIKIDFSNGESYIKELEDLTGQQIICLDKPIKTNYVKLTILKAYKGSKYSDTCISDIYVCIKEKIC